MLNILLASLVCVCVCMCVCVCVYICLEDEEINILKVRVCQTHPFSHTCIRPKKSIFVMLSDPSLLPDNPLLLVYEPCCTAHAMTM